jgi:hypothetical protein
MCYAKFAAKRMLQKQIHEKTEARMFMFSQQKCNIKINNECFKRVANFK